MAWPEVLPLLSERLPVHIFFVVISTHVIILKVIRRTLELIATSLKLCEDPCFDQPRLIS